MNNSAIVQTNPVVETAKFLAVNHTASRAGFQLHVAVSHNVVDAVSVAGGKHTAGLKVFLQACAKQMEIAVTDNKNWERTRFVYPMPTGINGSFKPEEVVIKTSGAQVRIVLASEEALLTH